MKCDFRLKFLNAFLQKSKVLGIKVMSSDNVLCPRASVYFVPGLGGINPDDFKSPLRQLVESIFGLHFNPKIQQVLRNKCQYAIKDDQTLLSTIISIAKKHDCCGLVSLVWFAHSHGARMVCEAYKQLQGSPEFPEIRKSSAIICIGGASLATDDLARVVLNVEYKNDYIAKGAATLIGDRDSHLLKVGPFVKGSCLCCDEDSCHEPEMKQAYKSVHGVVHGVFTGFKGMSNSAAGASARSSPVGSSAPESASNASSVANPDEERAHYIEGYQACKKWKQLVQEKLKSAQSCDKHV